jgi:hypothetical protein
MLHALVEMTGLAIVTLSPDLGNDDSLAESATQVAIKTTNSY